MLMMDILKFFMLPFAAGYVMVTSAVPIVVFLAMLGLVLAIVMASRVGGVANKS